MNLIFQALGLLGDIVVVWFVPILGVAIAAPVLAVVIAANNSVGGGIVLTIAALLAWACAVRQMWWQMWACLAALLPLAALAFTAPLWARYWALGLQALALGILFIVPGAIWPSARAVFWVWLVAGVVLTAILAGGVFTGGAVAVVLLGLLLLGAGAILFSQGARPWEIRRAQRQTARVLTGLGVAALAIGLFSPVVRNWQLPELRAPAPIANMWAYLSAHTEKWALSAQRGLLGERAKTSSLEEMGEAAQLAHKARWKRLITQVPDAPPSREEWRDLGIPQDP
ncbi:MAG: hypothetical protein KatS3mg097_122 [Candidatus Parcubacteria bacterium]|nr:MAG: hypothetical protein KatS3mg097_122 [Candidatus Parcubacteria bacterium]